MEIQRHLKKCTDCNKTYHAMLAKTPPQLTDQPDAEEQTQEQAILRALKKVVWKRVWGLVLSCTLAFITGSCLIVLILAQFHPEWDLPTFEHTAMRHTAIDATHAFIEGDIDHFLDGIDNMYQSPRQYMGDDEYNLCVEQMFRFLLVHNCLSNVITQSVEENASEDVSLQNAATSIQPWVEQLIQFLKENHVTDCDFIQEGVDADQQKELRKLVLTFQDSSGHKGVYTKNFYYGFGGYEPVDQKESIYGDAIKKETTKLLDKLFD